MKHPLVTKIFVFSAYGCAIAIGWHNVELSAIGLAGGGDIESVHWSIAVGMMAFESCLAGALGTPSFWPIMLGSAANAIDGILDATEDNLKYQFAALGLMIAFIAALGFFTVKVYDLDLVTTREAVYPSEGEPTKGQVSMVYGLVFGPEALLVAAGLAGLAGGLNKVQWNQVQARSQRLADYYSDSYGHGAGPDLNA